MTQQELDMSLNIPSNDQVQKSLAKQFGLNNTLAFYLKAADDAGKRLEVGIADKNALTLAKESRELIANVRAALAVLKDATNGDS